MHLALRSLAFRFVVCCSLLALAGCPGPAPEPDAGPSLDAMSRPDAPVSCERTDQCDDGVYCNGAETCESGVCVTAPLDCDDGVACTIDSCSEDAAQCTHRAPDADGDSYGDAECVDARGMPLGQDCDDADDRRFPGNREVCDVERHDEDCDPATLGGIDNDLDGFVSSECCNGTTCGDDCDDARDGTYPGATEVCDALDQDCDGMADDGVSLAGFVDRDRDGYGDDAMPLSSCASAVGWSAAGGDCNDDPASPTARAQNPGQPEICDGVRNDCSTTVAADVGAGAVNWYGDRDGDGFGSAASGVTVSCTPVAMASLLATDCNDASAAQSPSAAETCNGVDDDCNGVPDFRLGSNDYEDDDLDGLVDARCPLLGTDCDDRDPASGPGEPERCDGRDNDCDSEVDEGAASVVYYRDVDGDGYGSIASGSIVGCTPVVGFATLGGDCNDDDATRRPGATETCDAADEDCDTTVDEAPASSMCAPPNASASVCVSGRCTVDACRATFGDCNHVPLDGCESSLLTDSLNCGRCGAACAGTGPCAFGQCQRSLVVPGSGAVAVTRARAVDYSIVTATPARIFYTVDGTIPGSPTTSRTAGVVTSVTVNLGASGTQTLRWYVEYATGEVEAIQEMTHYTNAAFSPGGAADTSSAPRDNAGLIIERLVLNGSGPSITVARGATVSLAADATVWRQSSSGTSPLTVRSVSITRRTESGYAVVDCIGSLAAEGTYPGRLLARTASFTAPSTPGRYALYTRVEDGTGCTPGTSSRDEPIGYVIVSP